MNKYYITLIVLLLLFSSCSKDDKTSNDGDNLRNIDISITKSIDTIYWTNQNDLNSQIQSSLSYNYDEVPPSKTLKSFFFEIDSTLITASINIKEEFQQQYLDTNLNNNSTSIHLINSNINLNGVYITGSTRRELNGYNANIATIWKNGIATELKKDNTLEISSKGFGLDVFVDGDDIYVSGTVDVGAGDWNAKIWKNDVELNILQTNIYQSSAARSIRVVENDIYTVGEERNYSADISPYTAKIWKNGIATSLTNFSTDTLSSTASSMDISGNNIYVSGSTTKWAEEWAGDPDAPPPPVSVAVIWKNGIITNLTDGAQYANARSIRVVENNIYVAGYEGIVATMWKNGIKTNLTDGTLNAKANSISVTENDIYIVGFEGNVATMWKNGIKTNLTDGTQNANAYAIRVVEDDVYVTGVEGRVAKLWKNGIDIKLTNNGNLGSSGGSLYVN